MNAIEFICNQCVFKSSIGSRGIAMKMVDYLQDQLVNDCTKRQKGFPRALNILAHRAMILAHQRGIDVIDSSVINMLSKSKESRNSGVISTRYLWETLLIVTVIMAFVVAFALFKFYIY